MSNDWPWAQGLASIKALSCKAQGYTSRSRVEGFVVTRAHSLNRPLRTRTVGSVGAGSQKLPATRSMRCRTREAPIHPCPCIAGPQAIIGQRKRVKGQ